MAAYLTVDEFKARAMFPVTDVDDLETYAPGWLQTALNDETGKIDARLRKRYAVPFASPPAAVKQWLADIVSERCFIRRGVSPLDEQFQMVRDLAAKAQAEMTEAANAVDGLFDLPLATNASGIVQPATLHSSFASPFAALDDLRSRARTDDAYYRP